MKTALLLIDIQNDYFPGGKMELRGSMDAARQAGRLLAHFRQNRLPLVHVQHVSLRSGAGFFLPGTEGVGIHDCVRPLVGETVIQKHFPNAFIETPLLQHLRGLGTGRLVVAGMMTHMCVDATVRAAFDYGFRCLVASDACATRDLAFEGQTIPSDSVHGAFLAALHGTYGQVGDSETVLAQLQDEERTR